MTPFVTQSMITDKLPTTIIAIVILFTIYFFAIFFIFIPEQTGHLSVISIFIFQTYTLLV
jgi:hypothetical protein